VTQWQSVGFDFLTRGVPGAERGFLSLGRAASASSDDVAGLARRLDEIQGKRAQARVDLAGNKEALAQLDQLDRKLIVTGRKVTPDITVEGAAKASLEISALDAKLDELSAKSAKATSAVGLPGLSGVSGMGALIGAGVVLSPIITTIGFGVAGFGAAAAGAIAPVFKAAQAAGGLQKNMAKLDPEQQKVAHGLLDLGKQYHAFEQALQPQVLKDFSGVLKIAGHLMGDLEPVSSATGKAIGTLLGRVDAEFQSGTWTQFFQFMSTTAAPDIKLVGDAFITLMDTVPGLLEAIQPVATGLLKVSVDALKVVDAVSKIPGSLDKADTSAKKTGGFLGGLEQGLVGVGKVLFDPGFGISKIAPIFAGPDGITPAVRKAGVMMHGTAAQADAMAKSLANPGPFSAGGAAAAAKVPVVSLATSVKQLTAAMQKNVAEVLTLQGDEVQWRQSLQAADKQLRSNSAGLDGNTKNALANKQAVLQATQNVVTFADDQLTLGGNLHAASGRIADQIRWLQKHGEKSKFARDEIHALREEEAKIRATIRQRMIVKASGDWNVNPSGSAPSPGIPGGGPGGHGGPEPKTGGHAAGWRVPGYGGGDRWPALLEGGEAVVDKDRTAALAPLFKAIGVPGFAAGGVAGSFSGSVPGLTRWLRKEDSATLLAFENAVARATLAGIRAAQAGAGGQTFPGGLGRAGLRYLEGLWTGAGGPGAGTAHVASAIAEAESGGNPRAFNPSGASGLWQILGQVVAGNIFDPHVNALNAVSKYRSAGGFSPWVTFETGAYKKFMDSGGWLAPGWNPPMYNGTGRPEHLVPTGQDENLAPLLRQVIIELRKLPGVQAAQLGRVLSGRPVAPRPSVFASR